MRFIVVSVTAPIRMPLEWQGIRRLESATRNRSFCHTIFSMAAFQEVMTARQPVFPAAAAILLLAPHECGRQLRRKRFFEFSETGM